MTSGGKEVAIVAPDTAEALNAATSLWQVDASQLQLAMLRRTITAGTELCELEKYATHRMRRTACDAPHATHRTPRTHPLHDALAAQIASPIPLYLFSGTTTLSETWERVPRLLHARSAYACAS